MSRETLFDLVQRYLDRETLDGIALTVDRTRLGKLDEWFHVTVVPSHAPRRLHHFLSLLADVNDEILQKEDVKVILVPGDPLVQAAPEVTVMAQTASLRV